MASIHIGAPAKVAVHYDQSGQLPPNTALPARTQRCPCFMFHTFLVLVVLIVKIV